MTMNSTLRTETPDSEAVASSEDERPWPSAPSFGTLPRKENGVPGLGVGIWSTPKRGSFKMEKAAQRNAARDTRLGGVGQPRSALRPDSTPSPSVSDGSGALPFAIPLQPTPKAGRSLSHSQGQRELAQASGAHAGSGDHAPALPLGLLTEEVDDSEAESELGGRLTHTTSHPPIGTLQRTSTYPSAFESYYNGNHLRDSPEAAGGAQAGSRADRRAEAALANLSSDHPQRRAQWQTQLGWDDVPNVNESRRHSLADIPTRRGSLAGVDGRPSMGGAPFWPDSYIYDWDGGPHTQTEQLYRDTHQLLEFGEVISGPNSASELAARGETHSQGTFDKDEDTRSSIEIPTMYQVPRIEINDTERSEQARRGRAAGPATSSWDGLPTQPRRLLYIVSFKCSRVDVCYLLEGTGLMIKAGDIVIVEADRGQDLGTVAHANVTEEDARLYKRKYGEEQYKWLMMFSKNNQAGSVNPNAQHTGESSTASRLIANAPATMQGLPRENYNNLKPKAIKRLANHHEIRMLSEKEGNEAKAKRACQQKVANLHLDMEILDAEWQWDFQKLIFYYYADHYINFKDLITELYRIYKTRIWLSAINPASFSQHALGQPPSGIGPGAVTLNNNYTMSYGQDPDPYGAIPPYRISYPTYTPNYPAIPGVTNSFDPNALGMGSAPGMGGGPGMGSTPGMGGAQGMGGGPGMGNVRNDLIGGMPMRANLGGYGGGPGQPTTSAPPRRQPPLNIGGLPMRISDYAAGSGTATPSAPAPSGPPPGVPAEYAWMYAGIGAEPTRSNYSPVAFPALGGINDPWHQQYNTIPGVQGPPETYYPSYPPVSTDPVSNITAGMSRLTTRPAPIGTRPHSNGNSTQAPTSNPMQTTGPPRGALGSINRLAPDFVPGQQAPASSHIPSTFIGGGFFGDPSRFNLNQGPGQGPIHGHGAPPGHGASTAPRGNWGRFGGNNNGGDMDKNEFMRNYLEGLSSEASKGPDNGRANER